MGGKNLIDLDIIKKAKDKDMQAFRIIFNTYKQKVYATAYFILKDCQLAEDVVQETFLQIHLNLNKLKDENSFEGWVYKITANLCLAMLRKKGKYETVSIDDYFDIDLVCEDNELDIPDKAFMKKETLKQIMNVIYSLPIKHRIVITLFYFNDMSIKQITKIVGCSEGTVKSRLYYGKKELKHIFEKEKLDNNIQVIGGVLGEN
jgi:RNA polymerase sigma factor, sigma-70 family